MASPKWLVKAPDGKVIQFPDWFSPQDVNREMTKIYAPLLSPGAVPGVPRPVPQELQGMEQHPYRDALENTATTAGLGGGSALGNLVLGGGNLVRKGLNKLGANYPMNQPIPVMPDERLAYMGGMMIPFMASGGLAEGAALPEQMLAGGLSTGLISSAERGGALDHTTGRDTLIGMATPLGAAGLKAAAPYLAESALRVSQRMRFPGRGAGTIGRAILDETSGINPATVARQARSAIGAATTDLEQGAAAAGAQGARGSSQPALDYLDQQIDTYTKRNSPFAQKLMDLRKQLTENQYTGQAYPTSLGPDEILDMKRGFGDTINSWEPQLKRSVEPIKQHVYSLLDAELDRTVPGAAGMNDTISSLIPGKTAAARTAQGASFGQRTLGRFAAHTGALAGPAAGAFLGQRYLPDHSPVEGAMLGGALGLFAPELIASPTFQMGVARTMDSAAPLSLTRGFIPTLPQRPSDNPFLH